MRGGRVVTMGYGRDWPDPYDPGPVPDDPFIEGKPRLETTCLADVQPHTEPRLTSAKTLPLWRGYLAAVVGPGESGKTWLAAHAALDVVEQDRDVLVCDGEMSWRAWRRRLINLGASKDHLRRVHHVDMSAQCADIDMVRATADYEGDALIIWDSALSVISRTARSENDNAEVSRVYDRLRGIISDGPAGLIVDHTAASAANSVSRGATAKFNSLDLAYGVRLAEGSIPGTICDWAATVTLEKDRHGLLPNRDDREVLFHPLGLGALHIDLHEIVGQSNRLSANNAEQLIVDRIAGLDPPPTSGNDAFRRLGGTRGPVLAAYKKWLDGQSG